MGEVFGGITDAIGLTDYSGQEAAAKAASKSSDYAFQLAQENIKFQKQQYKDWKNVYGDIQENLGAYYKSISPERVISLGLQGVEQAYKSASEKIQSNMAAKGLEGSGIEQSTQASLELNKARDKANVRATAQDKVNQEKLGFLSLGLGQGVQMQGIIDNAYGRGIDSRTKMATTYLDQSTQFSLNNQDTAGRLWGFASGGTN